LDLLDLAILALRIALVALLYLFLWLVIRFAAQGLRPAQRHQLRLQVIDAGSSPLGTGELIVVADGAILGRTEQADLVVSDATVSVEHARVKRVGRGWVIADLGSTNGTRVNDSPVKGETPLAAGDVLGLGNVRLRVVAPR
jgi:pSer/pThr/pTyr-binding forkhead associated (FHA) protein